MIKAEQHLKSITDLLKKLISRILILFIQFYRAAISPYLGPSCRHTPTCSLYMMEAIKIWGPFMGTWLGIKRLFKCHPWGTSGYDPVPQKDEEVTD